MESFNIGDIVKSVAGRDEGVFYLVTGVGTRRLSLTDGKVRRPDKPKLKNVKHVIKVESEGLKAFADKINRGEPCSGEKLKKAIERITKK